MKLPYLFRKEIDDGFTQENFKRLGDWSEKEALLRCNFYFKVIDVPNAGANQKFPHQLNFVPVDVIIMHNSNNASITLNYSKFDATNLDITASGATQLRCLVGRYQ
jgi:hypothetical protein